MILLVSRLRKSYGTNPALRGIDLVLSGDIVAVLGPNGSGKTTLLRCLASSLRPDSGEIVWQGRAVWPDPNFLRAQLGYVPEVLDFPRHLTPAQLLEYMGRLKGCPRRDEIEPLIVALGLERVADRPFHELSPGQVRLAGIAQALLGDPSLLLLDEPTRGLDVEERQRVFRQLRRLAPRSLVVFSTHVPDEVSEVAGQVVVLNEGRVWYTGGVEALRRRAAGRVHEVHLPRRRGDTLPPSCRVTRRIATPDTTVLRFIGRAPRESSAVPVEPTLEEAYLVLLDSSAGGALTSRKVRLSRVQSRGKPGEDGLGWG
ncbi:MAG: ABC transporter ATP-binding protein [Chloroflexota bacterium]